MKTAVIAGYSGLIGSQLLSLLLAENTYRKVIAIGRRKLALKHPKLVQEIVDFDNLQLAANQVDDVFCCLGTTIKKAGSQEKFRLVDFQYPVNLANACLSRGAQKFLLVSSLGADENSAVFYNRVKGEVEKAVSQLGFTRIDILRPSLLLGHRDEFRLAESMGKLFMRGFGFLFFGPLKKYRAINSARVARAMLRFANETDQGIFVHESDELQQF